MIFKDYRNTIRDCDIHELYSMNASIADELCSRYLNKANPLSGQPHNEIRMLRRFIEVFNDILQLARTDEIRKDFFINALINSERFTTEEAQEYIKKAMMNGQIYERRDGILAKA